MKVDSCSRDIFSRDELDENLKEFYRDKKCVIQGSDSDCIVFGPPTNMRSSEERYRLVSKKCEELGVLIPEYYRRFFE